MGFLPAQAVRQVGGRLEGADTGLEARAAAPVGIGAAVDCEEAAAGEVAAEAAAQQASKQQEENLQKECWGFSNKKSHTCPNKSNMRSNSKITETICRCKRYTKGDLYLEFIRFNGIDWLLLIKW